MGLIVTRRSLALIRPTATTSTASGLSEVEEARKHIIGKSSNNIREDG